MSLAFASASSQFLEVDGAVPVAATPITFACWFKAASNGVAHGLMSLADPTLSTRYWCVYVNAADNKVGITSRNDGGFSSAFSSGALADTTTWHHCAGVIAGPASRIAYLDGTAGTEETTSRVDITPTRSGIGCLDRNTANRTWYSNGRIAHAAIWNAALTASQIAALAAGAPPTSIQSANLVAYAPLTTNASPSPDSAWSGQSWTWNNSPTHSTDDPVIVPPPTISGSSEATASGSLSLTSPATLPLGASTATAVGTLALTAGPQIPFNASDALATGSLDLATVSATGSRAAPGWLGLFITDTSSASVPLIAGGSTATATGALSLQVPGPALISGASIATAWDSLSLTRGGPGGATITHDTYTVAGAGGPTVTSTGNQVTVAQIADTSPIPA